MQFSERLTCTIQEAVAATGISRSKLYVLMDEGKIATTKPYSRRLIVVPSLLALLETPGAPHDHERLRTLA